MFKSKHVRWLSNSPDKFTRSPTARYTIVYSLRASRGTGSLRYSPGPEEELWPALLPPAVAACRRQQPGPSAAAAQRRRQVGPICPHPPGGSGCGRRAGVEGADRPVASPLLPERVDSRPSRLRTDSPPPRPASAVLICSHLSSFSSPDPLRPLHPGRGGLGKFF